MKKRMMAVLITICLLMTSGLSAFASGSDMSDLVILALTEVDRTMVKLALPFISTDAGLDVLEENLQTYKNGGNAGVAQTIFDKAVRYMDVDTMERAIDSLRVIDESFRKNCQDIYLNYQTLSLNSSEQRGVDALIDILQQKDSRFQSVLTIHQISDGMIAKTLESMTSLLNGKPLLTYSDGTFSVKNYPTALAREFNAIWQPVDSSFDMNTHIDTLVETLNSVLSSSNGEYVAALLKKTGLAEVKAGSTDSGSNAGGNNGGLGDVNDTVVTKPIEPLPTVQQGVYAIRENTEKNVMLTFEVTQAGVLSIPGSYQSPVVYDANNIPVKTALYVDGNILAELSSGLYTVKEAVPYFTDCDGWAKDYIETLYARNIISGRGEGIFAPYDSITREEFVKLITELLGLVDSTATTTFKDVPKDAWYYTYVASAQQYGIINGISASEFGTGQKIKRQDMAKIISDVLSKKGIVATAANASAFGDYETISDYAKNHVLSVCNLGIISGDDAGNFNPNQFANRAESAKMIYGVLKTVLTRG